ncbi:MAG: SIR2 family protein [Buchananella hordeovulneris]|nr:SIR2 family protein [Buchananella hordeovulneris]
MSASYGSALSEFASELRSTDEVVIYCGAGVTLSHTGVSWNDLLLQVAQNSRNHIAEETCPVADAECLRELGEGLEAFVYSSTNSAEASASAIIELTQADEKSLGPVVSSALYSSTGWRVGRLVEDVCLLALTLQQLGKSVRLITTNFDTFIEDRLVEMGSELPTLSDVALPPLRARVYGSETAETGAIDLPTAAPQGIEVDRSVPPIVVEYLHGRVDNRGAVVGGLVLSERSYQTSQHQTLELLTEAFASTTSLIIGSSLTDAPLLRSLCASGGQETSRRYAVMRRALHTGVQQLARARARHLGISLIEVGSYADVARFLRDAEFAVATANGEQEANSEVQLERWYALKDPAPAQLDQIVATMRSVLAKTRASGQIGHELLKLECWVLRRFQGEPALERVLDTITGVVEPEYRRIEPVTDTQDAVAAVRALRDGRPNVFSLSDLGFDDEGASRWRSICAVPCWDSIDSGDTPFTVVITLASTGRESSSKHLPLFERVAAEQEADREFKRVAQEATEAANSDERRAKAVAPEAESFLWHLDPASRSALYTELFQVGARVSCAYWAGEVRGC